jgi:hypothetical protein
MGLRRNSLELRDGVVKFVLSDLACHTRNVPSLRFHQAAEAIRGGWSANLPLSGCGRVGRYPCRLSIAAACKFTPPVW